MFWIAMRIHIFFRLFFTCLSIKLLCDWKTITTQIWELYSVRIINLNSFAKKPERKKKCLFLYKCDCLTFTSVFFIFIGARHSAMFFFHSLYILLYILHDICIQICMICLQVYKNKLYKCLRFYLNHLFSFLFFFFSFFCFAFFVKKYFCFRQT